MRKKSRYWITTILGLVNLLVFSRYGEVFIILCCLSDSQIKIKIVGQVTQKQLEEIAKLKMADLNAVDLDAACKIIAGTARSMGIEVV